MSKKTKTITIILAALVIIGVAGYFIFKNGPSINQGASLDMFAKCLKDKGALFYGAFWCSHCKDQKEMFGSSVQYIPYVECSTPDGKGQLQVCTDAKIEGYPTWVFSDGSRKSGAIPLPQLAEKTGCTLPQ